MMFAVNPRDDAERLRVLEKNRLDATPVVRELRDLGYAVDSIGQLYTKSYDYRSAIPVLIRWLPRIRNSDVKDSIVRALSVKWARPQAASVLISEFRQAPQATVGDVSKKWAIGNALSVVADDSVYDDIVDLVTNPAHGEARGMLPLALRNMKSNRVAGAKVAEQLLEDDEVVAMAIRVLAALGTVSARPRIKKLTTHRERWVRDEAKRALVRLDRLSARSEQDDSASI